MDRFIIQGSYKPEGIKVVVRVGGPSIPWGKAVELPGKLDTGCNCTEHDDRRELIGLVLPRSIQDRVGATRTSTIAGYRVANSTDYFAANVFLIQTQLRCGDGSWWPEIPLTRKAIFFERHGALIAAGVWSALKFRIDGPASHVEIWGDPNAR